MLAKRVLVVDRQPLYRAGVRAALQDQPAFRLIGEAGTGHQALRLSQEGKPHVALIGASLPGITGVTLAQVLRQIYPRLGIVLVSDTERRPPDDLSAIDRAVTPPALIALLWRTAHRVESRAAAAPGDAALLAFTVRELEVLDCIAQGLTNREAAQALFLTEQTVKNHMTMIMRKLGVDDRVEALLQAVRRGWVDYAPVEGPAPIRSRSA